MVTKTKLRLALAAEKGVDIKKLKQLKKYNKALKSKTSKVNGASAHLDFTDKEYSDENGESSTDDGKLLNLDAVDESDSSDSEIELEFSTNTKGSKPDTRRGLNNMKSPHEIGDGGEENGDDEEDIPMSDLEELTEADREDLIPHTRLTINNSSALLAALDRISIPTDRTVSFASHQSIISSLQTSDSIPDVSDDLQRELAFYSQCLEATRNGRARLISEGVPFSRPKDYFAEMVKEDAHMEKIKAKLVEEASAKKASAEARKLRDLKKFGKQVQVAKLQERQKMKREALDKIKTLKRKRQESGADSGTKEADFFDVGVDDEISKHSQHSSSRRRVPASQAINTKRHKKNEKYGFGGKKKHAKSGDAVSSGDLSGFNTKKMKSGSMHKASRPGRNRRKAMISK